jgi:hypothetical protein
MQMVGPLRNRRHVASGLNSMITLSGTFKACELRDQTRE